MKLKTRDIVYIGFIAAFMCSSNNNSHQKYRVVQWFT